MPRARFYNLAPEERERLLGQAMAEFAAHGFAAASLNRILAAAGLSKGVYYYYFEDKEDLLATAVESALDGVLARLALPAFERLTRKSYWPALARVVADRHDLFDSARDLLRALRSLDAEQLASPRFAGIGKKARGFWRHCIEAGRRLGCVRTDLPTETLVRLVEAADHALDAAFLAARPRPSAAAFSAHVDLVFDTFKRLLMATEKKKP